MNRLFLTAALCCVSGVSSRALTNITGNLVVEAQRLENFSKVLFGEGSNNYVAPNGTEWIQFKMLAASLWTGDTNAAQTQATALGYDLFTFRDTNWNVTFFGVRSQETNGSPVKGWGTYFVNTNSVFPAIIESPHPQWDFRSPLLAAEVYLKSGARGLMIAGAHRHVNGTGTGDPCDLTDTIFHAVHEEWSGPSATNLAWQIHGFSPSGHPEFPDGTLAVLSTGKDGDNFFSTNLVRLDRRMEWNGIKSYGYAKNLALNDPLNLLVNEGVDGQTFSPLGARSNVQGDFSHAAGGDFLHIETATTVRTDAALRSLVADAIACAVLLSRTNEPSALAPFQVTSPVINQSEIRFQTATENRRAYRAEMTELLSAPSWQTWRVFPGTGSPMWVTNALPQTGTAFFRIVGESDPSP